MRDYEKHVLDVEAHVVPLLWFYVSFRTAPM
jgi:hypothetical protein